MTDTAAALPAGLERLRQFGAARRASTERCEMCGADIPDEHGHVANVPARALLCVCRPCYLLFVHGSAGAAHFKAVPDRFQSLTAFAIARRQWDALQVPVGIAFFFHNSQRGAIVGLYPSPAGATESTLPLDAWRTMVEAAPPLGAMESDVEALLVRRRADAPGAEPQPEGIDAYVVPINVCYELVGRIRRSWKGFQGGPEAWREIDGVFARIEERCR